ncbi:unnamed protein product [Prunus armeniaca]
MDRAQRVDEVSYLTQGKRWPELPETASENSKITNTSSRSSPKSLGFFSWKMDGSGRGHRYETFATNFTRMDHRMATKSPIESECVRWREIERE